MYVKICALSSSKWLIGYVESLMLFAWTQPMTKF